MICYWIIYDFINRSALRCQLVLNELWRCVRNFILGNSVAADVTNNNSIDHLLASFWAAIHKQCWHVDSIYNRIGNEK